VLSLEERVFDAVVEMCKDRLIYRIKKKSPLGGHLKQVMDAVKEHYADPSPEMEVFIHHGNDLLRLLSHGFSGGRAGTAHLKDIVDCISRFINTVDIRQVLRPIKRGKLDSELSRHVVRRLEKIYQYRKAARFLSRSVKKLGLFRNSSVTAVSLEPEWFPPPPSETLNSGNLQTCFSRCQHGGNTGAIGANSISEVVQIDRFVSTVEEILKDGKYHAEVQLVAYFELNPAVFMPRVIASSKKACYMCDLFIKSHGRFHIKKTHGRLYHRWRIPPIPALLATRTRFNTALETRIREAVRERAKRPFPVESTVLSFSDISSTGTSPSEAVAEAHVVGTVCVTELAETVDAAGVLDALARLRTGAEVSIPLSTSKAVSRLPSDVEKPLGLTETQPTSAEEPSTSGWAIKESSKTAGPSAEESMIDEPLQGPSARKPPEEERPTGDTSAEPYIMERPAMTPPPRRPSAGEKSVDKGQHPNTHHSPTPVSPLLPLHLPSPKPQHQEQQQPSPRPPSPKKSNLPTLRETKTTTTSQPTYKNPSTKPQRQKKKTTQTLLKRGQTYTHRLDISHSSHSPSERPNSGSLNSSSHSYKAGKLTIYPELILDDNDNNIPFVSPSSSSSSSSWPSFPESSLSSNNSNSNSSSRRPVMEPLEMRIRWLLQGEEEEAVLGSAYQGSSVERGGYRVANACVIPAESVPDTEDLDSGCKERVYLAHGRDVVEIRIVRKDSSLSGSNDAVIGA
jgi:hypothetical protein